MYKVLIAEDEMLVRMGLKNSIDWDKFDMKVVADVPHGLAAWEKYEKDRPDLIITDLKMPFLSGMELIEKIREKDKKTKIIILSCLEEFDLLRKAMSLGVSDYIVKLTMSEEEIEAVLEKAKKELDSQASYKVVKVENYKDKEVIKEKFLKEYLYCKLYSPLEFEIFVKENNLRINSTHIVVSVMEIDKFRNLQSKLKDNKGLLIKLTILNILNEVLENYGKGEVFYDNDLQYILIISLSGMNSEADMRQEIQNILQVIENMLRNYMDTSVSFGVSKMENGYDILEKIHSQAINALQQKFLNGTGKFFEGEVFLADQIFAQKMKKMEDITCLKKLLDNEQLLEYQQWVAKFTNGGFNSKEATKGFFCEIFQWLLMMLNFKNESASIIVEYIQNIGSSDTLEDMIEIFNMFISEIFDKILNMRLLSEDAAMAIQFIRNNYTRNIGLQEVADSVRLSPSYVSKLLKKELKVNFTEYLNEIRVENAKALLLETYLKSYEIAEKVGFSEHTYFSKVFKKLTGQNPNEYRKKLLKEWTEELGDEENRKTDTKE